jgi:hypothetical protein
MKLVKLSDKSKKIQLSPDEALQKAIDTDFGKVQAIVVLYDGTSYEYWQGGGCTNAEMVWHLEQMKMAVLEDRHHQGEEDGE